MALVQSLLKLPVFISLDRRSLELDKLRFSFHNSFPPAIVRVSRIALSELPNDASEDDKLYTNVTLYKGDITCKADIEKVFETEKVWGVIHIAAHKAVGESGEKPIQYYENNISATINLLDVRSLENGFVCSEPTVLTLSA
ncbi:UDP-glucose-4-epimerase [Puccinia graminis f. sp. tritici]|uniref:UDP-glucose-4-epimerase n=1 Tax=Puccinia graminis f. sp. tritici TaxID=56615 RepID=A0A5B0M658_PUCGR|nr:UDP-glucose-4-epimerase [Puccinia graminis f. sp. tritici]KAA1072637.1 UDP-glucose-4-epimerase [Puccinia graminis f. sp. tritici]